MFSFLDYMYEVWEISTANDVDVGVGFAMFKAAVIRGDGDSNTEKALPGYDFTEANAAWSALTEEEERKAVFEEWHEFMRVYYHDACKLYMALTKED